MTKQKQIGELRVRLKDVVINTCNKVGCKDCDLKWEGGCSATELDNLIWELELSEVSNND